MSYKFFIGAAIAGYHFILSVFWVGASPAPTNNYVKLFLLGLTQICL